MAALVTNARKVGVDIGGQTTMLVDHEGEIIRTSTGSIGRPTVLTMGTNSPRLFGEEAAMQASSEFMLSMVNKLCGRSFADLDTAQLLALKYQRCALVESDEEKGKKRRKKT